MDQYVVRLEGGMLYWDMMELYDLIKNSDNENLKEYLPWFKKKLNEADPGSVTDEIEIL
jgi:hypothetical protein